jgi:hypothetical protein
MPPPGETRCTFAPGNRVYCPFPQIQDVYGNYLPLDYCRVWAGECGKAAADAYCRRLSTNGGLGAESFRKADDIGQQRPTVVISDKQKCKGAHCDGFYFVYCKQRP